MREGPLEATHGGDAVESKLALVTGANSGVGREATRDLARSGWTVLMLCRSLERGEAALAEIQAELGAETEAETVDGARGDSGVDRSDRSDESALKVGARRTPGDLHLLPLDLEDLNEVRRAAGEIGDWLDDRGLHVHALVNNAGVYRAALERSPQGFERTMAVNHLGHFALTVELESRLRRQGVRVVNVSSEGHRRAKVSGRPLRDILSGERFQGGVQAYCDSKLANVLFSEELQRRWGGDGVTSVAVHPGTLATAIWDRNTTFLMWVAKRLKRWMGDPSEGGRAVSRLVEQVPADEMAGRYYNREARVVPAPPAGDPTLAAELWRVSEEAMRTA